MKFRFHRGTLADSMETCVDLAPTRAAIAAHCNSESELTTVTEMEIKVEWYATGDSRISWYPVYIVKGRHGVIGFTNEPVQR